MTEKILVIHQHEIKRDQNISIKSTISEHRTITIFLKNPYKLTIIFGVRKTSYITICH